MLHRHGFVPAVGAILVLAAGPAVAQPSSPKPRLIPREQFVQGERPEGQTAAKVCPPTVPQGVLDYRRMYEAWWKHNAPFKVTPAMQAGLDAWRGCEEQQQRELAERARLQAENPPVQRITNAYDPWTDYLLPAVGLPDVNGTAMLFGRSFRDGTRRYFVQVRMTAWLTELDVDGIALAGVGDLPLTVNKLSFSGVQDATLTVAELSESRLRLGLRPQGLPLRIRTVSGSVDVQIPPQHVRELLSAMARA